MTKLAQRERSLVPTYGLHMQQLFQQLYNLSYRLDWETHGLDGTVARWITGTIMEHVADSKYFMPKLRSARSLKEIVMEQHTLISEMEAAWEQVRVEAREEVREEVRRSGLLDMAAPWLTAAGLDRCTAAVARTSLEALPTGKDVGLVVAQGGDVGSALERLLTRGRSETEDGGF